MADENHVTRVKIGEKEWILIGTAHVSKQSAEEVRSVIEEERPDAVCVELDRGRYETMMEKDRWAKLDIFQVIKEKKAVLLLINLVLASFQKRIGKQFGVEPGQEMAEAVTAARDTGAEVVLADRNIQITFARIWGNLRFFDKIKLAAQLFSGIFASETISEEELEALKQKDMLEAMLQEFTEKFPRLKQPLIDERDEFLAQKIREAPGKKIVAVLGAAHVPGVRREMNREHDLQALETVPNKSKMPVMAAWGIPLLIVILIVTTFFLNPAAGMNQTMSWVLWNGTLSALGAMAALAHPLAILAAFLSAPLTSLHPLIAAGWVSGLVQAFLRRPNVRDFESLSEDVHSLKGFWRNRVTRILLVVVFTNIGSTVGTIIAGLDVIQLFLKNLF